MPSATVKVDISGIIQTQQAIQGFTVRMADAAARKAVRAAARPVITQARANIAALPLRESTGLLRSSIGLKVKKYRGKRRARGSTPATTAAGGVSVAIVGPRKGYKRQVVREGRKSRRFNTAAFTKLQETGGIFLLSDKRAASLINAAGRAVWADPVKYAHLIEGGVKPHAQKRGLHPGFGAMPWLERALRQRESEARAIMLRTFQEALVQEAARARQKARAR